MSSASAEWSYHMAMISVKGQKVFSDEHGRQGAHLSAIDQDLHGRTLDDTFEGGTEDMRDRSAC